MSESSDDPLDLLDTTSLASLPSSSASDSDDGDSDLTVSGDARDDAEREWNESLQQLELILTMVLVPYLGRYFGRKCAYWDATRWLDITHLLRGNAMFHFGDLVYVVFTIIFLVSLITGADIYFYTGWARFMEWKYPVSVVFTSPGMHKAAGIVEAAAAL